MEIRILEEQELKNAAGLSRYVFDNCLRNRMEFLQTVPYVEEYLKAENLISMYRDEKLMVWGLFEEEQLVGVSGLQSDGMITLLYILPQFAQKGGGAKLLRAMRIYAKSTYGMDRVSLNANPAWTAYYFKKQGFQFINSKQDMHVPFVQMYADYDKLEIYTNRHVSWKVIVLAILGCLLFGIVFCCCFMAAYLF